MSAQYSVTYPRSAYSRRRSARLRRRLIAGAVALAAAIVATEAGHIAFISVAGRTTASMETAVLLPRQAQSRDIVVAAITEETLESFRYRSPVDRQFLADLLTRVAGEEPRAIVLDVLLDQ